MHDATLRDLIEAHFDENSTQLPVFNPVALELQSVLTDDSIGLPDIVGIIQKDQTLTSNILRVANSSFYGGLKTVDTLSRAVVRLGLNRVASLAMTAAQFQAHQAQTPIVANHLPSLWQHSYACATGAHWLATQSGYRSVAESAFLAGLLHNIGELFLLKALDAMSQNSSLPFALTDALIEEILAQMHADIGYRLMINWGIPEQYAIIARDHAILTFDQNNIPLVCTRLMNIACHKLGIGGPSDADIVLAATEEAQTLGLRDIKLAELEILLEDNVAEADAMLRSQN